MKRTGKYNEVKDLSPVDQVGYIDLGEAIRNGYIPASMNEDDTVYNEIDDPASLMHNASDVFELYRQADYVKSFTPKEESTTE